LGDPLPNHQAVAASRVSEIEPRVEVNEPCRQDATPQVHPLIS